MGARVLLGCVCVCACVCVAADVGRELRVCAVTVSKCPSRARVGCVSHSTLCRPSHTPAPAPAPRPDHSMRQRFAGDGKFMKALDVSNPVLSGRIADAVIADLEVSPTEPRGPAVERRFTVVDFQAPGK